MKTGLNSKGTNWYDVQPISKKKRKPPIIYSLAIMCAFLFSFSIEGQAQKLFLTLTSGGTGGGGTVSTYDVPTNNLQVIKSFNTSTDPRYLTSELAGGGNGLLYGVGRLGGQFGDGAIYSIDSLTNAYSFVASLPDGTQGYAPLRLASNGKLYGLTLLGGAHGQGIIYSLDPTNNQFQVLYDIPSNAGQCSLAKLIEGSNGELYGVTRNGGTTGRGSIFSYNIHTGVFLKRQDLTNTTGSETRSSLVDGGNGLFYISMRSFGASGAGTILAYDPQTNQMQVVYNFSAASGSSPEGSLSLAQDGMLYGYTRLGGSGSGGVIFRFNPITNAYSQLYSFQIGTGYRPFGKPFFVGSKMFGVTNSGGNNSRGVAFSFDVNTNQYNVIAHFTNQTGTTPLFNAGFTDGYSEFTTGVQNQNPVALCKDVQVSTSQSCLANVNAQQFDNGSNDPDNDALNFSISPNGPFSPGVHSVTLTVDDGNGGTDQCSATLTVEDILPPTLVPQNITLALDANGQATITAADVVASAQDNCGITNLNVSQSNFDCSGLGQLTTVSRVSDANWTGSTVEIPWPGTYSSVQNQLPDASTYTLSVQNVWPYNGGLVFSPSIPNTQPIFSSGGIKFYKTNFNLTGQPSSLRIRARVDNTMEIFVNGQSIGMEDDVTTTNFNSSTYHDVYIDENGVQNGYQGGQSFDQVTSLDILSLLQAGDNELVFAIGNIGGADEGGFTVRLDAESGGVPVQITASDDEGNSDAATAYVLLVDDLAPTVNCPANISTFATSANGAVVHFNAPTASDNCGVASLTQTAGLASGSTFPLGSTTVTYEAVDASGNSAQCSFVVNVEGVPPAVVCPNDLLQNVDAGQCGASVTFAAQDDAGIPASTITYSHAPGSSFVVGTTVVTATATNAVGSSSCTFNVTVVDNEAPTINCPSDISVNSDPGYCGAVVNFNISSSDNCGATLQTSHNSGDVFAVGTTTVTATATDAAGNSTNCSFDVTVTDAELPTISCPFDITINADPGQCGATVSYDIPTATDNCGTNPPPTSLAGYTYKGTFNGHTYFLSNQARTPEQAHASALATGGHLATITSFAENQFVSQMSTGRIWIGLTDRDHEGQWGWITNEPYNYTNWAAGEPNNAGGSEDWAVINWSGGNPNWNDWYFTQPALYSVEFDGGGIPTQLVAGPASGDFFPVGTTVVTYEAVDAAGNAVQCSFNVTVNDNQGPAIACPSDVSVFATSAAGAVVNFPDPSVTDNCPGTSLTQTSGPISGGQFPIGTTTVSFVATDASGYTAHCSFNVEVVGIAPEIQCPSDLTQSTAAGTCAADVQFMAQETVGIPSSTITYSHAPGSSFAVGTTMVTATATNAIGTSTCTFAVTVQDNEPPVALCNDVTVELDASGAGNIVAADIDGGSNDACGIASFSASQTSFSCSNVGANDVILTVTDVNGNVSTCTAVVTVQDNVAPVALCQPVTIALDASGLASISVADVDNGSSDACGIASMSLSQTDFDCGHLGTNSVTLMVVDVNGNSSTCEAVVTVEDNETPVIVCPANIIQSNDPNACEAVVSYEVTATDNCGANIVYSHDPGSVFPVGTTTVSATATDAAGNSATCSFDVIVVDDEAPDMLTQDISVTLNNGTVSIVPADIDGGITDECGIADLSIDVDTWTCADLGDQTVILTATDIHGNVASAPATVTVIGAIPVCSITSVPTSNVNTGGDVQALYLGYGAQSTVLSTTVSGGSSFTYSWSGSNLDCYNCANPTFTPSQIGNYSFTVVIVNEFGCETSCTINICVYDVRVYNKKGKEQKNKVLVCHVPPGNPGNAHTISVGANAVQAHLNHGCSLGDCNQTSCGDMPAKSNLSADDAPGHEGEFGDNHLHVEPELSAFPNPSSGAFNIQLTTENESEITWKLMDATGKVVVAGSAEANQVFQVDTILSMGVYMLEVNQGDFHKTVRLIKN